MIRVELFIEDHFVSATRQEAGNWSGFVCEHMSGARKDFVCSDEEIRSAIGIAMSPDGEEGLLDYGDAEKLMNKLETKEGIDTKFVFRFIP